MAHVAGSGTAAATVLNGAAIGLTSAPAVAGELDSASKEVIRCLRRQGRKRADRPATGSWQRGRKADVAIDQDPPRPQSSRHSLECPVSLISPSKLETGKAGKVFGTQCPEP